MTASVHDEEIERITQNIRELEGEISAMSQRSFPVYRSVRDASPCRSPPPLRPFDSAPSHTRVTSGLLPLGPFEPTFPQDRATNRPPPQRQTKPKEIEARRYSGKEPIAEYLLQYELTARRNGWNDQEKAINLLCALDGPARSLLSEVNIDTASYSTVKTALTKRFGPVLLPEIHEQALLEVKMSRQQSIRELTPEVTRLTKLAYPELNEKARERFAIKALINAIPDKDATFYIREKNPQDLDEVCALYERFRSLTGNPAKPASVKGIKPPEAPDHAANHLLEVFSKQAEAQSRQIAQLTETIQKLLQQRPPSAPVTHAPLSPLGAGPVFQGPGSLPSHGNPGGALGADHAPAFQGPGPMPSRGNPGGAPGANVPRKPCPRCQQPGHWAKDCPQPEVCFRCGHPGHRRSECRSHLNENGPTSAPHAGPRMPRPY